MVCCCSWNEHKIIASKEATTIVFKIARCQKEVCPHQSVAIFAGDQIRRDRRIKSSGVSAA